MAPKVNCFAGFCHHLLATTNVHMHAYCYSLFESGMKQVCEPLLKVEKIYVVLLHEHKNNSKVDYS